MNKKIKGDILHRKGHLIGATLFWGVAIAIYYVLYEYTNLIDFATTHSIWIVLSFMACHFGAQLPDYDIIWKKFLPHRNVLTHSIFLPVLICLPLYFVNSGTKFLVPIFAMYLIGHGSHLFLDLNPDEWTGAALIHIYWRNSDGRKTMKAGASKLFLFFNGLVILVAGVLLLYFFYLWTPGL